MSCKHGPLGICQVKRKSFDFGDGGHNGSLAEAVFSVSVRADYLKWLRFYLDFCANYRHSPRDRDSLAPFQRK